VAAAAVTAYEALLGVPYALPKLDLAALPGPRHAAGMVATKLGCW